MPDVLDLPEVRERQFWGVRDQIRDGYLLLFRRRSLISIWGRSIYSHVEMACWWHDHLYTIGLREWQGGRALTLWSQVRKLPGRIDVYSVDVPSWEREEACYKMRGKAGHQYNGWGVVLAGLLHVPFARCALRPPAGDREPTEKFQPEFCSQAIADAYFYGADRKLVHNLSNRLTEPADLARSALTTYQFTLTS